MLRSSSICYKIEVIFHFIKMEVVLHYPKNEDVLHLLQNWGRLPFYKNWGRLPFPKIEVVSQIGSYYIPVRLLGQVLLISSYFTTSPGRPAGRMLDISKLRLISACKQSLTWSLGWAWQNERKKERDNAVYSGHYIMHVIPMGSTQTLLKATNFVISKTL